MPGILDHIFAIFILFKFARPCLGRVRSSALSQHLFSTTCCHFFSNFMDSEPLLATGSPFLQPILNFQQPFHFFCTDSLFFATNPEPCCNNCSNSCFLSDYSTTLWRVGRPFRVPSGLAIGNPRPRFSFLGAVFGMIFRSLCFYKKCVLGAKRCCKMAPKLTREATSEAIFTFSSEPWFWTTLQRILRIFRVPLTMKRTRNH